MECGGQIGIEDVGQGEHAAGDSYFCIPPVAVAVAGIEPVTESAYNGLMCFFVFAGSLFVGKRHADKAVEMFFKLPERAGAVGVVDVGPAAVAAERSDPFAGLWRGS